MVLERGHKVDQRSIAYSNFECPLDTMFAHAYLIRGVKDEQ